MGHILYQFDGFCYTIIRWRPHKNHFRSILSPLGTLLDPPPASLNSLESPGEAYIHGAHPIPVWWLFYTIIRWRPHKNHFRSILSPFGTLLDPPPASLNSLESPGVTYIYWTHLIPVGWLLLHYNQMDTIQEPLQVNPQPLWNLAEPSCLLKLLPPEPL